MSLTSVKILKSSVSHFLYLVPLKYDCILQSSGITVLQHFKLGDELSLTNVIQRSVFFLVSCHSYCLPFFS